MLCFGACRIRVAQGLLFGLLRAYAVPVAAHRRALFTILVRIVASARSKSPSRILAVILIILTRIKESSSFVLQLVPSENHGV
jgi:hypothetical protein